VTFDTANRRSTVELSKLQGFMDERLIIGFIKRFLGDPLSTALSHIDKETGSRATVDNRYEQEGF
jgi:hypothetical protein